MWARCPRRRSTSPSPRSETDGGLQVTGSHNPPEFNGFKMVLGGEAFHGDEILELWEIIVGRALAERGRDSETSDGSVLRRYREGIVTPAPAGAAGAVVVDCGNGAGSLVAVSHPARRSAPR